MLCIAPLALSWLILAVVWFAALRGSGRSVVVALGRAVFWPADFVVYAARFVWWILRGAK